MTLIKAALQRLEKKLRGPLPAALLSRTLKRLIKEQVQFCSSTIINQEMEKAMPGVSGNLAADAQTFRRDSSDNNGKMSGEDKRYAKDFENELRDKGYGKEADATHLAVLDGHISAFDKKDMAEKHHMDNEDKGLGKDGVPLPPKLDEIRPMNSGLPPTLTKEQESALTKARDAEVSGEKGGVPPTPAPKGGTAVGVGL